MVVVVAYLRTWGITLFPYINNWLIVVDSKVDLLQHLKQMLNLLQSLGIAVNWKKSNLVPSQRVQYIGAIIDSTMAKAFLPHDKCGFLYDR